MMGAGNASASLYKSNPNLNTFGGSKKQDIPTRVGIDAWANYEYQTNANGIGRNKLFIMNQMGGVGVGRSMFNTSYVQPRGLRKTVDISDIAYWDGEKHILKKNVTIPPNHSLTHTSTFTIEQGTILTVHGNFQSHGHIIIKGIVHIRGNHDHGKMTIEPSGSYIVSGTAKSSDESILKDITDTETNTKNINNRGTFNVQNGGNYTNAFIFSNLGLLIEEKQTSSGMMTTITKLPGTFNVDIGGKFTNTNTFNSNYGSTFTMNGTYQNDGTFHYLTSISETNGIMGTFSNNGTLQLSLDTGATACNMYIVPSSIITNFGTITIDADCNFYSYVSWTNNGLIDNNGNININRSSTLTNSGTLNSYNLSINIYKNVESPGIFLYETSQLINNNFFTNINNFIITKSGTYLCSFTNTDTGTFTNTITGTFTNEGKFTNNGHFSNQGTYTPSS